MRHHQQENQGPSDKRNKHDREARRAGTQRHDSQSDPAKFDEDLPYEQQPTWQRQGEEGRYRDTYNAARDERSNAPAQRTACGGGKRDDREPAAAGKRTEDKRDRAEND